MGVAPNATTDALQVTFGEVHTARIAHYAIDDEHLAVVAVVGERRKVGKEGTESLDLDTSLLHPTEETARHTDTGGGIVHQPHFYALKHLVDENVSKGIAYNIVLDHEEHDVDVMTGSKDVLLHGLEHIAADRKDADAVAPDEIGTVVVLEHLDEACPTFPFLSGVGSAIGRSMGLEFGKTFAADERTQHRRHAEEIIEQNAEHGQKIEHQDPCQRLGGTPVLRQHHHSDVERKNDDHYVQPNR